MSINFELLDLRAFITIIDLGSFRKAADALNISQPALSRRIKAFESKIGSSLLERSTRHVTLTTVGREIEPIARRTLIELDEQINSISDPRYSRSGFISVACVATLTINFLPRVIKRFNRDHPRVRFRILDSSSTHVMDNVTSGTADFGITFTGQSDNRFEFAPLFEDNYVAISHKTSPIAERTSLRWNQLNSHTLIGVNRSSGNRILLDSRLAKERIRLDWAHEVNHLSTAVGLVEQGLGVSVMPQMAFDNHRLDHLCVTPLTDPVISRTIGVIERRGTRHGHQVQAFLKALRSFDPFEL